MNPSFEDLLREVTARRSASPRPPAPAVSSGPGEPEVIAPQGSGLTGKGRAVVEDLLASFRAPSGCRPIREDDREEIERILAESVAVILSLDPDQPDLPLKVGLMALEVDLTGEGDALETFYPELADVGYDQGVIRQLLRSFQALCRLTAWDPGRINDVRLIDLLLETRGAPPASSRLARWFSAS